MRRLITILVGAFAASVLLVLPAAAQVSIGNASFLEWDVPASTNSAAGALEVVQTGAATRDVFYVTRQPTPAPRLIRLINPPTSVAATSWQSWALYEGASMNTTGGLKMRPGEGGTGQLLFIRDTQFIHRLETNFAVNNHTRWMDTGFQSTSDLALDLPTPTGAANLYMTGPTAGGGVLQRLIPPSGITRWTVGGGAGSVYLSGVAVRRTSPTSVRVYWSEPSSNMIGELNPATNAVRRWLLPAGVTEPRQLDFDTAGGLWVVTGSGHVVRLRLSTNQITPYLIPTPGSSPFGVGPDGLIGFTENATKKVGMLIADGAAVTVTPSTATIPPMTATLTGTPASRAPISGMVTPVARTGPATSTGTAATGIFVEATLPGLSAMPNAIEDDTLQPIPPSGGFARAFFYSVSTPSALTMSNRIARVVLERPAPVPTTLTLTPKAFVNPVDTQHCVTATVRDQFGEPMQGVNVEFRVTGSVTTSGDENTDSDGEAEFCYSGPELTGADAIHAWADWNPDNGMQDLAAIPPEPFDDATKEWVLPVSTPGCEIKITNGGWIIANNGDRASFGGNAKVDADGNVSGQEEYQDHGPADPMNVHGNVLAVVCDTTTGTVFGQATIDGAGSHFYRIDVADNGEPGKGSDTYRILLDTGYDSGVHLLEGGNVQIKRTS